MERPGRESLSGNLDRVLSDYEVLEFADEVIWPAITHIYGTDFRERAKKKPQKTELKRRIRENNDGLVPERILVDAHVNKGYNVINHETGEAFPVCAVNISLEEMRAELKEGMQMALEADAEEAEAREEEVDRWWLDDELDWQPWEGRSFHFTTDPTMPVSMYHALEAHDMEERQPEDRFQWEFSDVDNFERRIEGEVPEGRRERRSWRRHQRRVNKKIDFREDELRYMLSVRDCLEIRAALIRFGVPVEVLKMAA